MTKLKGGLTAVMMALALAACESKQEEKREQSLEQSADTLEDRADLIREKGDTTADRIERQDPGMDSTTTNRAADAAEAMAEKRADQMEEQAVQYREHK